MGIITRFAPSPTGHLHLGHAYSALFAASKGTQFLVRMEDIDPDRCRSAFETTILEDLTWLGLEWEKPIRRQSEHMADYAAALRKLRNQNLLYPCFCTRKDIQNEINAAGHAPHGPDGPIYPGICRHLDKREQDDRIANGTPHAFRLKINEASKIAGSLTWNDAEAGLQQACPEIFGDVVLARKDTPTSYHLAVTVDDHIQDVTLVTRGQDLFTSTHLHRLLQALLDFEAPEYHHHRLLLDHDGKRFAKRNQSVTLHNLRAKGYTRCQVLELAEWSF